MISTSLGHDAQMLEHAIAAKLVALGVDWEDERALHSLARAIFTAQQGDSHERLRALYSRKLEERLIAELAGLSQLMLRIMALSAEEGEELHAGPVWKAFARALYQEAERAGAVSPTSPSV
jgi:hypothetical protein